MAFVLEPDPLNALVYGKPHQGTIAFLEREYNAPLPILNQAAQSFFDVTSQIYQKFNYSETARLARAAVRKVANLWDNDDIKPITHIGRMQQAKPSMQRWIMAEPTVRELYHKQQCDGYSESYIDQDPKFLSNMHYDYRRVTQAVFLGGGETPMEAITNYELLRAGDSALHLLEQADILTTWNKVKEMVVAKGEDPTSKWNSML